MKTPNEIPNGMLFVPKQLQPFGFVKLRPKSKEPFEKNWQKNPLSLSEIQLWIAEGNNYGVLGGVGGLIIIDCDSEELETVVRVKHPATFTVKTGSGKFHFYYICPEIEKKLVLKEDGAHHGEIISHGSQVVGPGSIHPSGGKYQISNDVEIASVAEREVFDVLSDYINAESSKNTKQMDQSIPKGQRNTELTSLAGSLRRRGVSSETIKVALMTENSINCDPPLDEKEVEGIAKSVFRYDPKERLVKMQLPGIYAGINDLKELLPKMWDAIKESNNRKPRLFIFGDQVVRIEFGQYGAFVKKLNEDSLILETNKVADFWGYKKKDTPLEEKVSARVPVHGIKGLLATPISEMPLPQLNRIVGVPVLLPDGGLCHEGLNDGGIYYLPEPGLAISPVSENPSVEELSKAKSLLFDDLLVDFPFVTESDKAHIVALLVLPALRAFIDGPTPLHAVDAPCSGTGKGLLADVCLGVWYGKIEHLTLNHQEQRTEEEIFSHLLRSTPVIYVDNFKGKFESQSLESILTSEFYSNRILGKSKIGQVPIVQTFVVTGNNLQFGTEMSRRTLRVRLDSKDETPWLKTGFKHEDLRGWAKEHRGELIWAIFTMIKAWIVAGKPLSKKILGSFESWAGIVGGVLEFNKIESFLKDEDLKSFYAESDKEGDVLKGFLQMWFDQFGVESKTASEIMGIAEDAGVYLGKQEDQDAKPRKMGEFLSGNKDKKIDGKILRKGSRVKGKWSWHLETM